MVESKKNSSPFFGYLILAIIALAAMNFLLYGSYLVMAAFLLCLIWKRNTLKVSSSSLLIIVLAISYVAFELISSETLNLRIIAAPCAFITAYNLSFGEKEYKPTTVMTVIAYSMAIHSVLSFFYTWNRVGFSNFSDGLSYDVWSQELSTATGMAAYYLFFAACMSLVLMKPRWYHIAMLALCVVHDVMIGGRTFIVLILMAVALTVIIRTFVEKRKITTFAKYVVAFVIVAAVLIVLYEYDIFGVRSMFESSYMYRRFFDTHAAEEIGETSRWERKVIYLQNLFNYPFGGKHLRIDLRVGYAHDIWLDAFDNSGILTMLLLLAYSASSVFRFFRYARLSDDTREKVLFYVFPIIMNAAFFVEPIMSGAPMLFFMYCFTDGLISKRLNSRKKA